MKTRKNNKEQSTYGGHQHKLAYTKDDITTVAPKYPTCQQ